MTYNHWDSYPEWLGQEFVDRIKSHTDAELITAYNNMNMVDEDGEYGFPKFKERIMDGPMNLEKRTEEDVENSYDIEYTYIYDIWTRTLIAHWNDEKWIEKLQEQLNLLTPDRCAERLKDAEKLFEQQNYKYIQWHRLIHDTHGWITEEDYNSQTLPERMQVHKGNVGYEIPYYYIKTPKEFIQRIDDIAWDKYEIEEVFDIPTDELVEDTVAEYTDITGDDIDRLDEETIRDSITDNYMRELQDYLDKVKEQERAK